MRRVMKEKSPEIIFQNFPQIKLKSWLQQFVLQSTLDRIKYTAK